MAKRVKGKLHTGPLGGKYRIVSGRKVYIKSKAKTTTKTRVCAKPAMAPVKPGDFPVNTKFRAACAKNEKRRKPDAPLQILCREVKQRGVVDKYRRIIAAIDPDYLVKVGNSPERIMNYWSLLRQYVGPFSASPAQEAEFIAYARSVGLRDDIATGEAIERALAPRDRAILHKAHNM